MCDSELAHVVLDVRNLLIDVAKVVYKATKQAVTQLKGTVRNVIDTYGEKNREGVNTKDPLCTRSICCLHYVQRKPGRPPNCEVRARARSRRYSRRICSRSSSPNNKDKSHVCCYFSQLVNYLVNHLTSLLH